MWYAFQSRRRLCLAAFDVNEENYRFQNFLTDPRIVTQLDEHLSYVRPRRILLEISSSLDLQSSLHQERLLVNAEHANHIAKSCNMSTDNATNGAPSADNPTNLPATLDQNSITKPPQSNGTIVPDASTTSKKASKKERPQPQSTNTEQNMAEAAGGVKLTGAQIKKQKAAEKAARRAEKIAIKGEAAQIEQAQPSRQDSQQRRPSQSGASNKKENEQPQTPSQHHKRKPSNQPPEAGAVRIPFRPAGQQPPPISEPSKKQPADKRVPMVSHLYPSARPASLTSASREIHPSILTLALHLRSLTLCGSTARTLALLITLKRVIQSYTTPPSTALSRHLTTHLSHQISFLSAARPLGIAQGNAIRWLKKLISQLDPDLDDNDAKNFLRQQIDQFIVEKITYASDVIAEQACTRLNAEETILVYGKSSVVERTLLRAAREQGKKFKVVVVDSRPLFEGRNLAKSLLRAGMREGGELEGCEVVYTLISGLSDVLEQESVTKCFLGASGILGNGGLYSRCGTAVVAMMAKQYNVPVIVLGESLKFTAKMAVDSLSLNEVGDAEALVEREESSTFTDLTPAKQEEAGKKAGGKKKGAGMEDELIDDDEGDAKKGILGSWKDQQGLYLLHLMYDVTPKDYLDIVICELGTLPPGAVPVVSGVHGGDE